MTDAAETEGAQAPASGGKKGLLVGLIGALVAGGGGFVATYSGALDGLTSGAPPEPEAESLAYEFLPLDPLIISLGPNANARVLKFTAELEIELGASETVETLKPRILDVLNDYLRAVDESELADPSSLSLLRAQMLRRIQTVVGPDLVRDLLIIEFILN